MKKRAHIITFTSLFIFTIFQLNSQTSIRLNNNWRFVKGDLGGIWEAVRPAKEGNPETLPIWENVTLPHCFNAKDAVDPDVNYYQGPGWYNTLLEVNNPFKEGKTVLHFEGAGQKSEVYIYTTKVGSHVGGYDEWSVDITDAVAQFLNSSAAKQFNGKVPLSIRCDNSRDLEMMPSDLSDFNVYGGIYRYLNLCYLPKEHIENVAIDASVDAAGKLGKINFAVKLNPAELSANTAIKVEILDPKGKVILQKAIAPKELKSNSWSIKNPTLWSTATPWLYSCKTTISGDNGSQTIVEKFGFRHFQFVEKGPFLLNGKRLLIRGTHRHEDHAGVGAALTEEMMRKEMIQMKEMGVNFIRLGHYQQSRIILNLCDSLGILVWEEIPWCRGGLGGATYQEQGRRMMTNMIEQHRNHPSIILWGLGNENDWPGDYPEFDKQKIRNYMSELNDIAHRLDPSRLTSIRRCDFCKDIPDVYSPSIWAGWYRGVYTEYKEMTEKEIASTKRFFHAEWGGDSHAGRHSEVPDEGLQAIETGKGVDERAGDAALVGGAARVSKDGDWSESYICNLFDWHLKEQEDMPNLTGSAFWVFKDFSTPIRPENPVPYVNQKGVVERDGTPKESYFLFQSRWTDKPMVHIYGHSWPVRWGKVNEEKMVKVYSNCDEVELFVNGVSQGVKKRNLRDFPAAGLHWAVKYRAGENQLKAIGRKGKVKLTDEISQTYQTAQWGKPTRMTLEKIAQKGDTATVEVRLLDDKNILCLDARNRVTFGITGDGQLIDNLGTSKGSRVVELQNGRAIIQALLCKGKSVISVKSNHLPTVLLSLED